MLIAGQDWLDPSTIRIEFDLVNGESDELKELRVLGGPWTFFSTNESLMWWASDRRRGRF